MFVLFCFFPGQVKKGGIWGHELLKIREDNCFSFLYLKYMTTTNLPAHFFTTLLRFPLFGSSNNLLGLHGVTQISQGSVSDG